MLVLTSVIIFCAERKFLVAEPRGATLSNYEKVPGMDKIFLLMEDFEGFSADSIDLSKENFFSYGSAKITVDHSHSDGSPISLKSSLEVEWTGAENYGGWGKGIGANIDLDITTDFLNFRIFIPEGVKTEESIKIILEEDDNDDGKLQKDKDDAWVYTVNIPVKSGWQMISAPLKDFKDDNEGGDQKFNVTRKGGLHTVIFGFLNTEKYVRGQKWYFDFVCFSHGKISEPIRN